MADLVYEAPAKVNLTLLVRAPDSSGYHPLRSLVQTLEWCDLLEFDETEDDVLFVEGAELPDGGDNLVWKAIDAVSPSRPRLGIVLKKRIPVAAGLGGGSSDAAAAMLAMGAITGAADEAMRRAAPRVGADVSFFLRGGTAWMEGYGERISASDRLDGFAVAVAVPDFELPTPEVYGRWDELGCPVGETFPVGALPPVLRSVDFVRNDLTPAAVSLRPELADWMADLADRWDRPVALSGSGPAVFGYFSDVDEARSAADAVDESARSAVGVELRPTGVSAVE